MDTAPRPSHPVTYDVERAVDGRNRLTVAFRLILAIPHLLLVGGAGPVIGMPFGFLRGGRTSWFGFGGGGGVIGVAAGVTAFISWFAIVFTGRQPRGLWDFSLFYLRWRANVMAYSGLLRDEYPPFGTGAAYPVQFEGGNFPEERDRVSVGFRIILVIPHLFLLFFIGIAWAISALIAWFAILFTGNYPEGLYGFGVGYMRWSMRVNAYILLMHDEYPPFSLS